MTKQDNTNEKLHAACESGDLKTVKRLIKQIKNAKVKPSVSLNMAIYIAHKEGHKEIVDIIIQYKTERMLFYKQKIQAVLLWILVLALFCSFVASMIS